MKFYYITLRENQIPLNGSNIFFIRALTVIYLPGFYSASHFLPCILGIHKHIFTQIFEGRIFVLFNFAFQQAHT